MKEFNLDDIVTEIYNEYGFKGSKALLRKILRSHFDYILKVMRSKRNRVHLRMCDVHTIYTNPDLIEMLSKVADLDEARIPVEEKGITIRNKKFRNPRRVQKFNSLRAQALVHHLPELKP